MCMWSRTDIVGTVRQELIIQDRLLREQQSVRGLDALQETSLHPLIAQSFSDTGHPALRELYYPSSPVELPKGNQRDRCDLVLLPKGKISLHDPVDAHKLLKAADGTLFESVASLPEIAPEACDPADAFWVEIKVIAQHRYIDGVPVPNTKYAHDMLSGPCTDVVKLAADPLVRHAGVLVVMFNEVEEAGVHDITMAMREMIDRELPVGMPEYDAFPICDHAGNAWCTLALIPVRL